MGQQIGIGVIADTAKFADQLQTRLPETQFRVFYSPTVDHALTEIGDTFPGVFVIHKSHPDRVIEIINELKNNQFNWVRIVVITESWDHEHIVGLMRARASDVVPTSISPEALAAQIQQLAESIDQVQDQSTYLRRQNRETNATTDLAFNRYFRLLDSISPGASQNFWSATRPRTILIADDEMGYRMLLSSHLSKWYTIIEAENGKVALEKLHSHPEIDVAILDIRMPELTGDRVLAEIQSTHHEVEVIMLTAFRDADTAVNSFKAGAFTYLNKPVELDVLKNTVDRCIESLDQHLDTQMQPTLKQRIALLRSYLKLTSESNQTPAADALSTFIANLDPDQWEKIQSVSVRDELFDREVLKIAHRLA